MVGERYFAARERLLACIGDIRRLGEAVQLPETAEADEGEGLKELARPLRVVALGEVNAGKSTLLNALAGCELCEAGPLPMTQRTIHYRYGSVEKDVELKGGWLQANRPVDFLRRIELIDTPGSNSGWRDAVQADVGRFSKADLILLVFPSGNTWTAATWDLLSAIDDEALDRVLLVVQQSDEKSAEDLRVIEGHMRELSMKKVGRDLPILAMAAGLALESKISPETARKGWSASRFSVFEEFFTREVCDSTARHYVFDRSCQEAARLLRRIEDALDRQRRGMDDDGWFLAGLEREADQLRELVVSEADRTLAKQRDAYADVVAQVCRGLGRRLGPTRTFLALLFGDSTAMRVEADFAERLQVMMAAFSRQDASRLLDECEGHWGEVRPRVIERMGMDPGEAVISGEAREVVVERSITEIGKAMPLVLGQLRVRASLDAPLRQRNRRLKSMTVVLLLLLIAAGVCGSLGVEPLASWLLLGAGGWGMISLAVAWISGWTIVKETRQRLLDSMGRVESSMKRDYVESVRDLFGAYSNGLIGVRRQLANRQADLAPQAERWDGLYLQLKMIEQDYEAS